MGKRKVTEADFRMAQYRDAKPEDYEFRDDGKLLRKDRWETTVRRIASKFGVLDPLEVIAEFFAKLALLVYIVTIVLTLAFIVVRSLTPS